nr:MAG: hypothetical protein [Lake Baikal virophage 13]
MATERLAELLFENTDNIPEGLYLQLINLSRDCFKEREEAKKSKVVEKIRYRNVEDQYKYFSEYHVNPFEIEEQYAYINVWDKFEAQSPYRNKRIFYEIVKKNNSSFRMDKIEFELIERNEEYSIIRKKLEEAKYYKWENIKDIMIPRNAFGAVRSQIYRALYNDSSYHGTSIIDEETAKLLFPAYDF